MANIFDKENAALMSFGKVMSRMAAQPLDISEIWYNKTELETYAASDATAYAGQKVTFVDQENNKVYQYSIQTDGTLKEIGVAPTGDETSITVSAEGLVAMFGFAGAETGSVPVKDAETGKLAWKTLEEIGAGDGNDDTTYEITALKKTTGEGETAVEEIYGITIQTKFNGQNQGDPVSIAFDVYTKAEADAKFALKGEDAYDDTALANRVKAVEDNKANAADVYTKTETDTAIDNAVKGILGEGVDEAYNTLKEIQDILEGTDGETIDGLIETVDANKTAIATLNGDVETEGSVAKQIADAVAPLAVAEEVAETYATKQEITDADYAVATEVANTYATKQFIGEIPTDADATTIVGYINEKAQEVLDSATGGSSESAASVKQQLDTYKAANDPKVNALLAEVYGALAEGQTEYNYAADSRIDLLEKADTTQDALIASNTTLAQKGVDDAKTANDAIATLTGAGGRFATIEADVANLKTTTEGHGTSLSDHETRVAAIENAIKDGGSLDLRLDALEAADLAQGETNTTLQEQITANKTAIDTLNNTTIPAIQTTLGNKADATSVYTKTEIDAKTGTIAEGKTLVDMINEAAEGAEYDDTQVKADIKANTDAIAALAGEGNTSTVKKNADDIAAINALLNAVDSEDSITSLKELAIWVEEHETEVLPVINAHSAILAGIGGEGEKATVKAYVDDAIAAIPAYELPAATAEKLGGVKSAADVDGKVVANAVYVDATSNIGSVKAVSTDVLVNGAEEFVLFGGNAGVAAEA